MKLFFLLSLLLAQSALEQAVTLTREKHYAEARQALADVAEPDEPAQRIAFHRLKAAIAAGLKDAPAAAAEMRESLALSPDDPALLFATALSEEQAQQYEPAIAAYRKAILLDPSREDYRTALGYALTYHQEFPEAVTALREAVAAFPKSARLYTLLGIAQFAASDTEDAVVSLSRAITLDPGAEPAYRSLTQVVLQSSSPPDAKVADQLCSWDRVVCAALRVREARQSGNGPMLAAATTLLEQAPSENLVAVCELARALEWGNRLDEARRSLEACVTRDPSPQNHFRLGVLYQRLGLTALAQAEMNERNRLLSLSYTEK